MRGRTTESVRQKNQRTGHAWVREWFSRNQLFTCGGRTNTHVSHEPLTVSSTRQRTDETSQSNSVRLAPAVSNKTYYSCIHKLFMLPHFLTSAARWEASLAVALIGLQCQTLDFYKDLGTIVCAGVKVGDSFCSSDCYWPSEKRDGFLRRDFPSNSFARLVQRTCLKLAVHSEAQCETCLCRTSQYLSDGPRSVIHSRRFQPRLKDVDITWRRQAAAARTVEETRKSPEPRVNHEWRDSRTRGDPSVKKHEWTIDEIWVKPWWNPGEPWIKHAWRKMGWTTGENQ